MGESDEVPEHRVSRRELFRQVRQVTVIGAGAAGAAALPTMLPAAEAQPAATQQAPTLRALESFTAHEFATVTAMTGRLIPADASGPGAIEANVSTYIDRALNSHHREEREAYTTSLAALDAYSKAMHAAAFAALAPEQQDVVLTALERNAVPRSFSFSPSAPAFFGMVLRHTQEGMFGDPYYGGNAGFIGWDLIGFPGVKLMFTPEEQDVDHRIAKAHRSAYSYTLFEQGKP
jgi:gluconate 2-dehydrogenase gamma chain